jgi:hypothetical protein
MWWDHQNLNKPRIDKSGNKWNFRVWGDSWTDNNGVVLSAQRIFFWNDKKNFCGVVLLPPGSAVHVSRLHRMIDKLVADATLRQRYKRELRFPLERHYSDYGAFPEEQ